MKLAGKRVAVYTRMSTDKQRDASIEDQLRKCTEFVERQGGAVDPALVFSDRAVSGTTLHRRGFERLMEAVTAKRVDAVVVEDVSRLSRDIADASALFKRLQFLEVALLGVVDGADSTARGGRTAFGMRAVMADGYVEELRERTLRGLEGRALAGFATGGLAFGYRSVPVPDGRGGIVGHRIKIDEDQAAVVRRIFAAYLDGHSLASIAKRLNAEGVGSPRAKTKHRLRGWVPTTIRAMLRNERYVGAWTFGARRWVKNPDTGKRMPRTAPADRDVVRQERPELRIVDAPTWAAVQERLAVVSARYTLDADGRPKGRSGRGSAHPLSGLLVCDECGAPMTIYSNNRRARYRCADELRRGTCSNARTVPEDAVRAFVFGTLRELLASDEGVADIRRRVAAELGSVSRAATKELRERRARLARTEARVRGLCIAIADGDRSPYMVRTRDDLEAQARSERAAIDALEAEGREPVRLPSVDEVVDRVLDLEAAFEQEPVKVREELRRLFDGGIRLEPGPDGYTASGALLPLALLVAGKTSASQGVPGEAVYDERSGGTLRAQFGGPARAGGGAFGGVARAF